MCKKLFAVLGLSCILTVLIVACGGSNASAGPNPIHMSGSNFVQNSITIKKGESITLINDNLFGSHTIANGTKEFAGDYHDLRAQLWVNDQGYQDFDTSDMIYQPEELIAWASTVSTLRPGDVLSTGSGPGNGVTSGRWLQPSDVIEAEITGLGRQKTPVVAEEKDEKSMNDREKRRTIQ